MTSAPDTAAAEPQNLTDFILAEVHRQTSEEALRKVVAEKVGQVVSRAVDDSFRAYGKIGEKIAKAVERSLDVGDALDIPSYGNMVMTVLRAKMDEVLTPLVNERLAAEMTEILNLAPKELKLSELVKTMVEECDRQDRWGSSVTCLVEKSGSSVTPGYRWIHLDQEREKSKYSCEAQLGLDPNGKIYHLKIDGKDAKTTVIMGAYEAWKKQLFAAYACGSKLIVDEDQVLTGIGDD